MCKYNFRLYLSLHHGGPLCSQYPRCLEHVDNPFVLHAFQDDAQCYKNTGSTHSRTKINKS